MSLITNPDYLSKDRLKSELKLHGVKFNQNENKPYYVNLYRKRVMDSEQSRHEFSSDEELTRSYKPEKKQQVIMWCVLVRNREAFRIGLQYSFCLCTLMIKASLDNSKITMLFT